jgi:cell division protein ZapA
MPSIDIEVAGRRYNVACRAGEEDQLRELAAVVDARARDAATALGQLSEGRQLLFAALLLADDLQDARNRGDGEAPPADPRVAQALEALAERIERLADRLGEESASPLEKEAGNP